MANVESNHLLPRQRFCVSFFQAPQVRLLHDQNDVGPAEQPLCDDDPCARLGSCGSDLDARYAVKDLLCCEAPLAIAAANEQNFDRI